MTRDIESALEFRRGALESFDPLIKQFSDLPDVVKRLRNGPQRMKDTLSQILAEMLDHNLEILCEVGEDWRYAFRIAHLNDDVAHATVPGTSVAMGGVHLLAHRAIGDAFAGDVTYTIALNSLFNGELAREHGLALLEFFGLVFLAIVCWPLAMVAGIVDAAYHYSEAVEREHVYNALIDPELVITRADVEAQLFASQVGLALSFLPVAGLLGKGGAVVVRTVVTEGVTEAVEIAGVSLRGAMAVSAEEITAAIGHSLTRELAEKLERGLVLALIKEIATNEFMQAFIARVMEPFIKSIQDEVTAVGPQGGLDRALLRRMALLPRTPGIVD
jgi:hypothetical protein